MEKRHVSEIYKLLIVYFDDLIAVVPADSKAATPYVTASVDNFMRGFYRDKTRIREDGEAATTAIARQLKTKSPELVVGEQTPLHSSASNPAEGAVKRVEKQVRRLSYDVNRHYGIKLTSKHPLWPWLTRHSG